MGNKYKYSLQEATIQALADQLEDDRDVRDVEGVIDDILVITDPEINKDEYEEVIERAQEIVEDTPEGDIPFDDEYIGQFLQTCPICGNSFVEDHLLEPGANCPICLEQPEAFVVIGTINGDVTVEEDLGLDEFSEADDNGVDIKSEKDLPDVNPVPNTVLNRTNEPETDETPVEEPLDNEEGASEEMPRRSGGRRLANLRGRETASKELPTGNRLAESTKLEEAINPSNKLYQYEVGVLLDEDNDEYEAYSEVWDKKHGYYNEDWGVELDLDSAKKLVKDYVSRGVLNTYGIISEIFLSDEELDDVKDNIEENGYFETSDYDMDYSLDNVIYSVYKSDNGIVENFVNMDLTENKLQENKKLNEDIEDETAQAAKYIALEIQERGIMNFEEIDEMAADQLGITVEKLKDEQLDTDIYISLNYEGIDNNMSTGDFYTEEYAEEHPEVLDENKLIETSSEDNNEAELNRLQDELRGVDVSKLSDEEYEEFKIKSDRVHELVNKLYDFHKLGESKTIIDNGDEIYTIDKNAKTYTIKTPKGEKTFTFDEMNEFVNRGKGMNRIYKPMSVLAYTDFKNGNLNKWNIRVED